MLDGLHVVIPMAIHQVGDKTARSLGQVGGILLDDLVEVDALQQNHFLSVGREQEAFHLSLRFRELLAV